MQRHRAHDATRSSNSLASSRKCSTMPSTYELHPFVGSVELIFEPWKRENYCGGKVYKGKLIDDERIPVILKLWDGHKIQVEPKQEYIWCFKVFGAGISSS
jgi:hypothetical protein